MVYLIYMYVCTSCVCTAWMFMRECTMVAERPKQHTQYTLPPPTHRHTHTYTHTQTHTQTHTHTTPPHIHRHTHRHTHTHTQTHTHTYTQRHTDTHTHTHTRFWLKKDYTFCLFLRKKCEGKKCEGHTVTRCSICWRKKIKWSLKMLTFVVCLKRI